ncbi:hypothetical protein PTSG_03210 [Salpingoeca rosetta]|uniref:Uncharacterized protein n=1 Tax=Salpingoeca rosetta (strain ATCC 50818 / BSB-021) TaxID=946362 RepID=F2U4J2_SALR5|nr:uncharacterized protein PTSG_03210 [Salpingoeca rosetta]EGD82558.1 hypothetical protein PTSG_03210 [Salpingoeca rosetta]|eukprot:XP_004995794.1 hypothetical protein PTSG_03210 [Salpingoeca rosetta]
MSTSEGSGGQRVASTTAMGSGGSSSKAVSFATARGIDAMQFAESRIQEIKGLLSTLSGPDRVRRVSDMSTSEGSGGQRVASTTAMGSGGSSSKAVSFATARGIDAMQFAESRIQEIKGLLSTLSGPDRVRRVVPSNDAEAYAPKGNQPQRQAAAHSSSPSSN